MESVIAKELYIEKDRFGEINGFITTVAKKIREEEKKLPYYINIIDLLWANENAHSRILAELFKKKEILKNFFDYLKEKNPHFSFDIGNPEITVEKQRIDILIKEAKKYAIIYLISLLYFVFCFCKHKSGWYFFTSS